MKNLINFRDIIIGMLFSTITLLGISNEKNIFLKQLEDSKLWQKNNLLKLHLGCGENHINGYINIDYPPTEHTVQATSGADIFADITTLEIPQESVDEIRSHHVFEHFDRQQALGLLCNWHQQLKIGGTLIIETPDFERSAKLMLLDNALSYKEKQAILRHIFGSHEARWAIHCDGWYEEKYRHVLPLLGFEDIIIEHSRYLNLCNITVHARKTKNFNRDKLILNAQEIVRESLVAECETKMFQVWCEQLEKTVIP